MSASETRSFVVRYPRAGCVVGTLIFGAAAVGLVVYCQKHPGEFDPRIGVASALGWWFISVCVATSLLVCLKTAIFPSLLFAANETGLRLGRGIFVNHVTSVDWNQVLDLRASTMTLPTASPSGLIVKVPALEIVFDPSVVLLSVGLSLAFASADKFLLAQSAVGCSLDEFLAAMRDLKNAAVGRQTTDRT